MGFLLPPIKLEQFILFYKNNTPIGYVTWANFSASVEKIYIQSHFNLLEDENYWNCGDRSWVIDFFAPLGNYKDILKITRELFPNSIGRSLSHAFTGDINKDVLTHKGVNITRAEAAEWNRLHPLA